MRKSENDFAGFVLDQLGELCGVSSRPMFGGLAFYHGGRIFGMEYKGRAYLRVAPGHRERYESRGMKPFEPVPGRRSKNYYDVPLEVIEDRFEFARWARDAIAAAAAAPAKPRAKAKLARKTSRPRSARASAVNKVARKPRKGR